jgi:hypothetical protein
MGSAHVIAQEPGYIESTVECNIEATVDLILQAPEGTVINIDLVEFETHLLFE